MTCADLLSHIAWSALPLTHLKTLPKSPALDSPSSRRTVGLGPEAIETAADLILTSFHISFFSSFLGGYFITVPTMKPWFAWTRWILLLCYGLERTVSNEIGGRTFGCGQLVPAGPAYTSIANRAKNGHSTLLSDNAKSLLSTSSFKFPSLTLARRQCL